MKDTEGQWAYRGRGASQIDEDDENLGELETIDAAGDLIGIGLMVNT
jgi:hypothetical protein